MWFVIGFALGTILGTIIMAAMSAALWADRETEYINKYRMTEKVLDKNSMPAQKHDTLTRSRWIFNEPDKNGNKKPQRPKCRKYHLTSWADYAKCNYCPNCGVRLDEIKEI